MLFGAFKLATQIFIYCGVVRVVWPYLKHVIYVLSVCITERLIGQNAWRQRIVRDNSTSRMVLSALQKYPYISLERDVTGGVDRPAGFIMALTSPLYDTFFLGYISHSNVPEHGTTITLWCSERFMYSVLSGSQDVEKTSTDQMYTIEFYAMEANFAWGEFSLLQTCQYPTKALDPPHETEQAMVLDVATKTVKNRMHSTRDHPFPGGTIIMICGPPRTGKSMLAEKQLPYKLGVHKVFVSVDFTDPGQRLANIMSSHGIHADNPAIFIMNEWDAHLARIRDHDISTNMHVRTQIKGKDSLNDILDRVRDTPGLNLVVTTNKTPLEMLDEKLLPLSTFKRFNCVFYLQSPLANEDTHPSFIDPKLPGSCILQELMQKDKGLPATFMV